MSRPSNSMNSVLRQSSRGFFWHGVFILLPVVVLATVGLISLRQDRLLAEAEARQSAQRYADEMYRAFQSRLRSKDASERTYLAFRINGDGQLVMPPAAPTLPIPRTLEMGALSSEQQNWWFAATGSATDPHARANAIMACEKLLAATPPAPFAGAITYRLALLLDADGKRAEAVRTLQTVEAKYPDTFTESGVPLLPLAELKRFEWRNSVEESDVDSSWALNHVCSNLVYRPTFMTPFLLGRAGELAGERGLTRVTTTWQEEWKRHEVLRRLASAAFSDLRRHTNSDAATPTPPIPALFWIQPANNNGLVETDRFDDEDTGTGIARDAAWLAARTDDGQGGYWIVCRALDRANEEGNPAGFRAQLSKEVSAIPPWFDCTFQVAGRLVNFRQVPQRADLAPTTANILATAHGVESGSEFLRVNVHLVDSHSLYARQAARSRWFGLLIGTAALVALAGFISARRAFQRQRQLAEMKSNFVSSVSHELRAPIASVRLMAESLDRGTLKDPARQRDYYKFIVQECRRLGALIENVLDFARIEQGRKEYDPQPTDVAALLQQSVKLMEPAAAEKQVKLLTLIPDAPTHPDAAPMLDGHAIQQALVNLIDNAVKHSPSGATVTVGMSADLNGATRSGMPPAVLRFFVEDRGPGIPPEDRERIFERFYRRGPELRRSTQGVGIGLSIVKHIVEAHGGRVIVEGAVGQGSRFTIELPANKPTTPNTN